MRRAWVADLLAFLCVGLLGAYMAGSPAQASSASSTDARAVVEAIERLTRAVERAGERCK